MRELLLYTTLGCHLCEQAEQLLRPVLQHVGSGAYLHPHELVLREVEIADDPALIAEYSVRIPVLRIDGTNRELGWPFDQAQAFEFLNAQLAEITGS